MANATSRVRKTWIVLGSVLALRFLWMGVYLWDSHGFPYSLLLVGTWKALIAFEWAQHPTFYPLEAEGYFPPGYFWIYGLTLRLWPDLLVSPAVAGIVASTAALFFIYRISRKMSGSTGWALAAFGFCGLQVSGMIIGVSVTADSFFHLLVLGATGLWVSYEEGKSFPRLLGAAILLTLSCAFRYEGWGFLGIFFAFLSFRWRKEIGWFRTAWLFAAGALFPAVWLGFQAHHYPGAFYFFEKIFREGLALNPAFYAASPAKHLPYALGGWARDAGYFWPGFFVAALVWSLWDARPWVRLYSFWSGAYILGYLVFALFWDVMQDLHIWLASALCAPPAAHFFRLLLVRVEEPACRRAVLGALLGMFLIGEGTVWMDHRFFPRYAGRWDSDLIAMAFRLRSCERRGSFGGGRLLLVDSADEDYRKRLSRLHVLKIFLGPQRVLEESMTERNRGVVQDRLSGNEMRVVVAAVEPDSEGWKRDFREVKMGRYTVYVRSDNPDLAACVSEVED